MTEDTATVPSEPEATDPINSTNVGVILSMYVAIDDDESENDYRIQFGDQIKYITLEGGILDHNTRSFPPDLLAALPKLPRGDWVSARISKPPGADKDSLSYELSYTPLEGIASLWHPTKFDIQSLTQKTRYNPWVSSVTGIPTPSATAILKTARFEFEIYGLEKETAFYRIVHDKCPGLAPAFLGHVTEHGRAIGFLVEFIQGRHAGVEDLEGCQAAVKRLHAQGILHGDVNRYNFIVAEGGRIYVIEFANSKLGASEEEMRKEYDSLPEKLAKNSGSGEPIIRPV